MPDKWEYPWYAAWDLAFHCIPLALIDPEFAKEQLVLFTREWYMHPSGQLPAYEWAFGDVNPPVHAWAAWRVFQIDRKQRGDRGDLAFLERVFHKLLLNFTWWVNRKDATRPKHFPRRLSGPGQHRRLRPQQAASRTAADLDQADATGWMAMYCLNLMRMALELAIDNPVYQDIASKFFEHFLGIAHAMNNIGEAGSALWDEEDQFFYDRLIAGDGQAVTLRVRSMVGLIPLFAVETLEPDMLERLPGLSRPAAMAAQASARPGGPHLALGRAGPGRAQAALSPARQPHEEAACGECSTRRNSSRIYGVRSLSRHHERNIRSCFRAMATVLGVGYEPGESQSSLFGGNSNWRGPSLDAGQLPDHRVASEVPPLLWRRLQGRVPDRLGQVRDHE